MPLFLLSDPWLESPTHKTKYIEQHNIFLNTTHIHQWIQSHFDASRLKKKHHKLCQSVGRVSESDSPVWGQEGHLAEQKVRTNYSSKLQSKQLILLGGHTTLVCNQPPRSTQPPIPSVVREMSTGQSAQMLCRWE